MLANGVLKPRGKFEPTVSRKMENSFLASLAILHFVWFDYMTNLGLMDDPILRNMIYHTTIKRYRCSVLIPQESD